jgi:hypothetical protein
MTDDQIISLAETHGATHKQSLGVYQFFKDELIEFSKALISLYEDEHEIQTDREQESSL